MSLFPHPTSSPLREDVHGLTSVRSQVAFVRALLDELERLTPIPSSEAVAEQLVEELARLGCRCIEAASALVSSASDAPAHSAVVDDASRCA